ncbi:MAG: hypothetical protein LBF88_05845 [Planctomycetaceae bacterium]|jgi:hypothetical protein|nr:hypothetical protein [Planctomycetaceae bacterium]
MSQPDAISFFFVLFLTSTILPSLLLRCGFSKSITFFNGLRFVLFWMAFVTVLLVMNQAARETVNPGRWPNERFFVPVVQENLSNHHQTMMNLLFGWLFFPMRTLPFVPVQIESVDYRNCSGICRSNPCSFLAKPLDNGNAFRFPVTPFDGLFGNRSCSPNRMVGHNTKANSKNH